ncbi:hypothetical protein [Actinophytocola sp.]|uniref:hypothetical protein n=1 Tax=Actinophytocola sp. TaxID=1872138 RepID=UPI003D6C4E44
MPVLVARSIRPVAEDKAMSKPPLLFVGGDLSGRLEELRRRAHQRLMDGDPDELLAKPEADITEGLLGITGLECPTLRQTDAYLLHPTEVSQQFREFDEVYTRRVTRFTLVVPFDGDPEVFKLRASSRSFNPPQADVHGNKLHIFSHPAGGDAAQVKSNFDTQLDEIERYLGWSRRDLEQHRQAMEAEIPKLVADRRSKLLADRELHANIGFPIKRRPDADAYAVPLRRRQVAPRRGTVRSAPARPFQPEPTLTDEDYEAALAVLRNMRNALERNPSTTGHLSEEQIRDLLLVSLNAQFEGKAAGEVFNGAGKTDILIRVDDRNVFIGECKIWKGPKTVTDALNQLLGYLVWRDTKAALLLFIRDADVSTVTAKAVTKVEEHPNYKRRSKTPSEERYDFVLHAPGDPAREIHLALLPFLIAGKDGKE